MLNDKDYTVSEGDNQTDFREVVTDETNIENEVVEVMDTTDHLAEMYEVK